MSDTLMLGSDGSAMLWPEEEMARARRMMWPFVKSGYTQIGQTLILFGDRDVWYEPAPLLLTYQPRED